MKWRTFAACAMLLVHAPIYAWGPEGHRTVADLAYRMIAATPAQARVDAILAGTDFVQASVWADCAKAVDPKANYSYVKSAEHPECAAFETPQGEAEMEDFVRRNSMQCEIRPGEEICHKQYHYADIDIARRRYRGGLVGARNDDVVAALSAAAHKLRGDKVPAPFNFKDDREALRLLIHLVGDIHQPLHVGTVYLDAQGQRAHPQTVAEAEPTDTRGGNLLSLGSTNLHALWDSTPLATAAPVSTAWVTRARAVPSVSGDIDLWPAEWATQTLHQAHAAFEGITFGPEVGGHWNVELPSDYDARMETIKEMQLIRAGAHLAQLLEAIWP